VNFSNGCPRGFEKSFMPSRELNQTILFVQKRNFQNIKEIVHKLVILRISQGVPFTKTGKGLRPVQLPLNFGWE